MGDVMGTELLEKSFPCEMLGVECLFRGHAACWRRWVVSEAWVGWVVLVEVEACGLRAVALEAGHTELWVSARCLVGGLWAH